MSKSVCLSLLALAFLVPAWADPTITLGAGVMNPPPSLLSADMTQMAVADTASLIPVATFTPLLQATLNAQGFTNANNWTLVNNLLMLDQNATFNIKQYNLYRSAGGNSFGEAVNFTLNPNLAGPVNTPPGSIVTEHWVQILNEDRLYNGFGYAIAGQPGFWQVDNGDMAGGKANGWQTGPYYDSNSDKGFSVPPGFFDSPQYYSGVGTYLHFDAIPTWDVYDPKNGTESIDVGDYGFAWGFQIVGVNAPEPGTLLMLGSGALGMFGLARRTSIGR
jgi:hypothetical protein